MNSLKEDSQRVRPARLDYPVNVIFHETPGKNADLAVGHIAGGEREIGSSVAVGKEDILAIYTALGNVINQSGLNASVVSRHTLSECQR